MGSQPATHQPLVIVVGAGFGGLAAVKALRKAPVDVLLIDRHNFHLFTPLLYQVASSLLDPSQIAYPTRALARRLKNARFRLGTVRSIDLEKRLVVVDDESLAYDYLILAAGSINDYFGNDALAARTFQLKTLDQALVLRYHIMDQFERASATTDPEERRSADELRHRGRRPDRSRIRRRTVRADPPGPAQGLPRARYERGPYRPDRSDNRPCCGVPPTSRKAAGRALARRRVTLSGRAGNGRR